MEKDRLVLPRKKRRREKDDSNSIRVWGSTMEIIDEKHEESCLSKVELIDRMIKFAANHIEWSD